MRVFDCVAYREDRNGVLRKAHDYFCQHDDEATAIGHAEKLQKKRENRKCLVLAREKDA